MGTHRTIPINRIIKWPMLRDQELLPEYHGGPTQLMAALDAEMKREKLTPIEPRGHCSNCRFWRVLSMVSLVGLIGALLYTLKG